ncbi:MAG: DUF488 domain-containing protein [Chitinophagaceae bacterium]
MSIKIKRAYESFEKSDGYRILVDRLWPRGIKKENAHIDVWIKEVAPSTELRKWFDHDPKKWKEFISKYKAEIKGTTALKELKSEAGKYKTVTLVYAAKDEEYNNAVVLQKLLM